MHAQNRKNSKSGNPLILVCFGRLLLDAFCSLEKLTSRLGETEGMGHIVQVHMQPPRFLMNPSTSKPK